MVSLLVNSRAQSYCKHWEIPKPIFIHSAPIVPIQKSESRDSIFRNEQVKHRLSEQHGPSMYTLSMCEHNI